MANSIDQRVGRRILQARSSFPTMTAALAAKFLGISMDEFLDLENGMTRPTPEVILLLADLFDVEPSWFFQDAESPG